MSDFWFNCDSCGRQNVGVTFVNGMRFCAKCYQETFGNTNTFEKEFIDKIKVLEKALELACDYLTTNQDEYDELTRLVKNIYNDEEYLKTKINYFKTKAKEMMKSE